MDYENQDNTANSIAIIGMAGRFPKARNIEAFWKNLRAGKESIHWLTDDELANVELEFDEIKDDPTYVRARGMLDDIDMFDASFFGLTPYQARALDPQQRVWLETAWEALERAGYAPKKYEGAIGVFAGEYINGYLLYNLLQDREAIENLVRFRSIDAFINMLSNDKDYLPTRTSYLFDLTGPSVNIQTACSSSLVAVSQACQSLLHYESDICLAGGVCISIPQEKGYFYQEGGMVSPDGHCRPFDAKAAGTVFSSGVGVVVLKRLDEALADGDNVLAVVKGSALNNDGALKASYTAPSVDGQAEVIRMAQAMAGVEPESISYVEGHGTATPLGDPIEVAGLTKAFRAKSDATQYCGLGSVKSNVGHLDAASGVTGLIKTVLALHHEEIPATLHYKAANPQIDFENSPFYVVNQRQAWPKGDNPRRAGVSSFGVGGTNVHVVLEEAPELEPTTASRPRQLLMLSAKTESALDTQAQNLANYLNHEPNSDLADVAFTLQRGRADMPQRRIVVASTTEEAYAALMAGKGAIKRHTTDKDPEVIFMFPGQGAQHVNMGRELYETEDTFKEAIDRCAELLEPLLDLDLRDILYPDLNRSDDFSRSRRGGTTEVVTTLNQTGIAQPAIFAVEYALAQVWLEWGIQPAAMVGHSVGEYTAACLAGVFSLEDALTVLASRARLMQSMPGGSMRAIRLSEQELRPHLGDGVFLAAHNARSICIVSGPTDAIDAFDARMAVQGHATIKLHTSHAFHSSMMEPVLQPFTEIVASVARHAPQIPILSTLTGRWATDEELMDPTYWAQQLRQPVRFSDAIKELQKEPGRVLLEVGPSKSLSTSAMQHVNPSAAQTVIDSLGHAKKEKPALAAMLEALGRLWMAGVSIDWDAFYQHESRRRVILPSYPFERKRYWVEPPPLPSNQSIISSQSQSILPSTAQNGSSIDKQERKPLGQAQMNRKNRILEKLQGVMYELSGIEIGANQYDTSFMELGLDSLTLTQVSTVLKKEMGAPIKFRKLLEDVSSLDALADYYGEKLPADAYADPEPVAAPAPSPAPQPVMVATAPVAQAVYRHPVARNGHSVAHNGNGSYASNGNGSYGNVNGFAPVANGVGTPPPSALAQIGRSFAAPTLQALSSNGNGNASAAQTIIQQQIQLMGQQLQLLGAQPMGQAPVQAQMLTQAPTQLPAPAAPAPAPTSVPAAQTAMMSVTAPMSKSGRPKAPKAAKPKSYKAGFGPYHPVEKGEDGKLTPRQQRHLHDLMSNFIKKTKESKRIAQAYRVAHADPRSVANFRRLWKEIIYQVVSVGSAGSKIWDADGNEYIDISMGFGINLLGHSPKFITKAIKEQLDKGIEIAPQAEVAGDVANLVSELTGMERVSFCNTGSEAVLATIRIARTVTDREKVVYFSGDYHGVFDEMLARPQIMKGELHTMPAAPGILPSSVEHVYILDYGTDESLEFIREHAHELAAVLIEPIQSRHPYNRPTEFLREIRKITQESGTVMIFDEVITGFRVHQGGAQAVYGIQADLAAYGKVVGGGMPIGVVAGKAEFMDAIDGGWWQFGDDSVPEAQLTFFAGTFVRHPLTLAAAKASLTHLKEQGPQLQERTNAKTTKLANELNAFFEESGVPIRIRHYSSWYRFDYPYDLTYAPLLFFHMLEKGIYIREGGQNCFVSTAHSDEDLAKVVQAVKESVWELQDGGFFPKGIPSQQGSSEKKSLQPVGLR